MPNSVTIRRAILVAFSMSFAAPVVVSPKISFSADVAAEHDRDLVLELRLASAGSGPRFGRPIV